MTQDSFLTAEQRQALDTALAEKAAEHKAAGHHVHHKPGDRKSRTGKAGAAKKGGGGGKWTWGNALTDGDNVERVLDSKDPNYDSEEEKTIVLHTQHQRLRQDVQVYKQEVADMVAEYFTSGDIGDVAESLEELGAPGFMHYFVKRLVTSALDHNNREREMASVLLSSLYATVIPPDQVQKGFVALIDSLPDLVLDVPDAPQLLALFIVRAVVDDVLPPAIAGRIPDHGEASKACKAKVDADLTARHSAEKVLRCWGSGAGKTHADTKDSITRLLAEFTASGDAEEAARCLHALNVPFFHHEVVKQTLHRAMECVHNQPSQAHALIALLLQLSETGQVSAVQLRKGLARVADSLDDLALDHPGAVEQHAAVMALVKSAGLLDAEDGSLLVARRMSAASLSSAAGGPGGPNTGGALKGVAAFKEAALAAIREYFDSSDAQEVARRLTELNTPGLLHIAVKLAVVAGLERRARERELVSVLFNTLHPGVLDDDAMAAGFTRLLSATDDLVLDCPDAVHLLSLFLGRAIVDEVLPPAFLAQVLAHLRADSLAINVVKATGAVLSARHGAERMSNAWRGGAQSLDQVRGEFVALIREYLAASRDVGEVTRCLADLGVPDYHHELVVKAVEAAFEGGQKAVAPVTALLASLASSGVISATQMTKGFSRMRSSMAEETLDYGPSAAALFDTILSAGKTQGWLVE